jgi:hypothetical protein
MKKLFIAAVLLAALGGALYYFFEMKKKDTPAASNLQQTITGEWLMDSLVLNKKESSKNIGLLALALDTNFTNYSYAIQEDGRIIKKLGDSTVTGKIRYQIIDSSALVIHEDDDNTSYELKFYEKQKNSFALMDKDSTYYFFTRKQK